MNIIEIESHVNRCGGCYITPQISVRLFLFPVDGADAGMRGGGRALSDG